VAELKPAKSTRTRQATGARSTAGKPAAKKSTARKTSKA
jgi:hypothetical protein